MIIAIIIGVLGVLTGLAGIIMSKKNGEDGLFDLDAYRRSQGNDES